MVLTVIQPMMKKYITKMTQQTSCLHRVVNQTMDSHSTLNTEKTVGNGSNSVGINLFGLVNRGKHTNNK